MTDSMTTRDGKLVQAHVGNVHVEQTANGVEMTLVGAVTPTTRLTPAQARRLGHVLSTSE
jgi:hypothetical protein